MTVSEIIKWQYIFLIYTNSGHELVHFSISIIDQSTLNSLGINQGVQTFKLEVTVARHNFKWWKLK